MDTTFGREGPEVRARGASLALELAGVGYGAGLAAPEAARPASTDANRVEYRRGDVTR